MGIRALEQAKIGRPLCVRHQGAVLYLPDPVGLPHNLIVWHIQTGGRFLIPGARISFWKAELLLERWLAHHGLGTPADVARLGFLVDRYEGHLTWDLQSFAGVDLGDLWRRREYRRLLHLIDHLPRHSYYSDAVANDPEHSRMIAEARARAKAQESDEDVDPGPPLTGWTHEVEMLANVVDSVNGVRHAIILANSDPKKSPPKPPENVRRPKTVLQRESVKAERRNRQHSHEALVSRLLPHKAAK